LLRIQYGEYGYDVARIYSGSGSVQDLDGNGFIEMILEGGIPTQMAALANGFPFRTETHVFSWNGRFFVHASMEYSPPQYRFQAVQDGDRFSLSGDYDKAVDNYQQAIFSDKLDWWSAERRKYILETQYTYSTGETATPMPPPSDPDEYYNLAAYSRYRIMLLHVVRGWLPEAQIIYNTLLEKFPVGQVGHVYAEMATAFWDEYGRSQDVGMACAEAINFAEAHASEILVYLGNTNYSKDVDEFIYFGDQSLFYEPQDICPFK
jgi:hypothetical protein